jgi:hypothetical protein
MQFKPPPTENVPPPEQDAITLRQREDGDFDQIVTHSREDVIRAAREALRLKQQTLRTATIDHATPERVLGIMDMLHDTAMDKEAPKREAVAAGATYLKYTVGEPGRTDHLEVEHTYTPEELREQAFAVAHLDRMPADRPQIGIADPEEMEGEAVEGVEDNGTSVQEATGQ